MVKRHALSITLKSKEENPRNLVYYMGREGEEGRRNSDVDNM